MKILIPILTSLVLLSGCDDKGKSSGQQPPASSKTTLSFKNKGMSFQYQPGWYIALDLSVFKFHTAIIKSFGDDIIIIQIFAKDNARTHLEFAKKFAKEAAKKMPFGKMLDSKFSDSRPDSVRKDMQLITESFNTELLGKKTPFTRRYFMIKNDNQVGFIVTQRPVAGADYSEPGFRKVIDSFKMLPGKSDP